MAAFVALWIGELRSKVPWVLWVIVSAVVAVSGPFGSYGSFGLGGRLLFWTPVIGLGVLTSSAIRTYVTYHPRQFSARQTLIFSTILVCVVLSPPLYLLTNSLFSPLGSTAERFAEIAILVAAVSMGATALRQSLAPMPPVGPPQTGKVEEPRLLRRLELDQRGPLLAISVRDHYVDVQTKAGTVSLLMRFSDAVAEASPVQGAQIHRSHWVAWAAVVGVERDGAKLFLRMQNGTRLPVSKNHRAKLSERGLL